MCGKGCTTTVSVSIAPLRRKALQRGFEIRNRIVQPNVSLQYLKPARLEVASDNETILTRVGELSPLYMKSQEAGRREDRVQDGWTDSYHFLK